MQQFTVTVSNYILRDFQKLQYTNKIVTPSCVCVCVCIKYIKGVDLASVCDSRGFSD